MSLVLMWNNCIWENEVQDKMVTLYYLGNFSLNLKLLLKLFIKKNATL